MGNKKLNLAYASTEINGIPDSVSVQKKTKISGAEIYILAVSGFIVILFAYTGVNKFLSQDNFVFQMQLVPVEIIQKSAIYLGWIVPILELLIIAIIIPDKTRFIALISSFVLMLIFEGYIIWMRSTGLELPCPCGGIISSMSWVAHMIFNIIVIILLAVAIYFERREWWNRKIISMKETIKRLRESQTH